MSDQMTEEQIAEIMELAFVQLCSAAYAGDAGLVRLLLETKADANVTRGYSDVPTVLLEAVQQKRKNGMARTLAVVRVLLDGGADPNGTDFGGQAPLIEAAGEGYLEIVEVLLEFSADPKQKNGFGECALALARQRRHADVVHCIENLDINHRATELCKRLKDCGSTSHSDRTLDITVHTEDQHIELTIGHKTFIAESLLEACLGSGRCFDTHMVNLDGVELPIDARIEDCGIEDFAKLNFLERSVGGQLGELAELVTAQEQQKALECDIIRVSSM